MHDASETVPSLVSLFATEANLGGADRDRTGGLLVANQALSQLSYSPNRRHQFQADLFRILET